MPAVEEGDDEEGETMAQAFQREIVAHFDEIRYKETNETLQADLQAKVFSVAKHCEEKTRGIPSMPMEIMVEGNDLPFPGMITAEDFARLAREKPSEVFKEVKLRFLMTVAYAEQNRQLHKRARALDANMKTMRDWIPRVLEEEEPAQDERAERLIDEVADRAREVEELRQQLADQNQLIVDLSMRSRNAASAPRSEARSEARSEGGGPRSDKLPDPPVFHNDKSKDVDGFEQWYRAMKNKLQVNADRYHDDHARQSYVESRLGGNAKLALEPYLSDDNPDPINTSEKLLSHLWEQYRDATKAQQAHEDWRNLKLKPGGDFLAFKNDFVRLAGAVGQVRSSWKNEFNARLYPSFKRILAASFVDPGVGFDKFTLTAQQIAIVNKQAIEEQDNRPAAKRGNAGNRLGQKRPAPVAGGADRKAAGAGPAKTLTSDEVRILYQEGRCFVCREKGHTSRNCPLQQGNKDREARLKALQEKWAPTMTSAVPPSKDRSTAAKGQANKVRFEEPSSDSEN